MAACYRVIVTLNSRAGGEGQLVKGQVPHLGECLPSWTPLEDLDEGVRSTDRRVVLHYSNAKEGKCGSETVSSVETLFFEKAARAYYHNHTSIAYLLCCVN